MNSSIRINFQAKHVFVVMGISFKKEIPVKIKLNGKLLISGKGKDVNKSIVQVSDHTLYSILSLDKYQHGILELTSLEPGLEVYTFTYGD